jgi:hypothetical protein
MRGTTMGKSLFPRMSSFTQENAGPKGPPPAMTPGSENIGLSPTQKLAAQQLKDGPDRSQLERWYSVVNAHLDDVGDPELEDVRNEIYSYLH